eukprot:scaffold122_cov387-Prasinococcus_capsulatus_cf.AAC.7
MMRRASAKRKPHRGYLPWRTIVLGVLACGFLGLIFIRQQKHAAFEKAQEERLNQYGASPVPGEAQSTRKGRRVAKPQAFEPAVPLNDLIEEEVHAVVQEQEASMRPTSSGLSVEQQEEALEARLVQDVEEDFGEIAKAIVDESLLLGEDVAKAVARSTEAGPTPASVVANQREMTRQKRPQVHLPEDLTPPGDLSWPNEQGDEPDQAGSKIDSFLEAQEAKIAALEEEAKMRVRARVESEAMEKLALLERQRQELDEQIAADAEAARALGLAEDMEKKRQVIKDSKRNAQDTALFNKAEEIQRMEQAEQAELAREKQELGLDLFENRQVIRDNPAMREQMLAEEAELLEREIALFHLDEAETVHHVAATNTLPHSITVDAIAEAQRAGQDVAKLAGPSGTLDPDVMALGWSEIHKDKTMEKSALQAVKMKRSRHQMKLPAALTPQTADPATEEVKGLATAVSPEELEAVRQINMNRYAHRKNKEDEAIKSALRIQANDDWHKVASLNFQETYGLTRCSGCRFADAITQAYEHTDLRTVLDVGCGGCGLVRALRQRGLQAFGVESSRLPLELQCDDLLRSGTVQASQLSSLPFPDSSFDLVVAVNVLEFIPHDQLDAVMAELVRVARLRTLVIVEVPSADFSRATDDNVTPVSLFPQSWWDRRLEASGVLFSKTRHDTFAKYYERTTGEPLKPTDGVLTMSGWPGEQPPPCLSCGYIPAIVRIYGKLLPYKVQETLIVGNHVCPMVRYLQKYFKAPVIRGIARLEYLAELDCADLLENGIVESAPMTFLPAQTDSFEVVAAMNTLEFLREDELDTAIRQLRRVSAGYVFVVIETCGNRLYHSGCAAKEIPGIKTLKPRSWWISTFASAGLRTQNINQFFPFGVDNALMDIPRMKHSGTANIDKNHIFPLLVPGKSHETSRVQKIKPDQESEDAAFKELMHAFESVPSKNKGQDAAIGDKKAKDKESNSLRHVETTGKEMLTEEIPSALTELNKGHTNPDAEVDYTQSMLLYDVMLIRAHCES